MTASYDRTSKLLESYRLNLQARSLSAVRDMIFEDIRRFSELGALAYVADIRKALFRLEAETLRLPYSPAAADF